MNNVISGMFGQIEAGMCRLSMNGDIAIHTNDGYKSYNVKKNRLVNCSNFVFDNMGDDFFFLIPTNKVTKGDIILVKGTPRCVIDMNKSKGIITVLNYEDSTIEQIVPERHVFMGNTYFYGKIVSMFGNIKGDKKNTKNLMQYMMLSKMMGTNTDTNFGKGGMESMLPMMIMMNSNGFGDMFGGLFDDTDDEPVNIFNSTEEDDDEEEDVE